eukprot:Awhi_evm1s14035
MSINVGCDKETTEYKNLNSYMEGLNVANNDFHIDMFMCLAYDAQNAVYKASANALQRLAKPYVLEYYVNNNNDSGGICSTFVDNIKNVHHNNIKLSNCEVQVDSMNIDDSHNDEIFNENKIDEYLKNIEIGEISDTDKILLGRTIFGLSKVFQKCDDEVGLVNMIWKYIEGKVENTAQYRLTFEQQKGLQEL